MFGPFDLVEQVNVIVVSDHVLAWVAFQSKHAAAEAFGGLHGRCVYTGCYQLDIKWGLSQVLGLLLILIDSVGQIQMLFQRRGWELEFFRVLM